MDDHLCIYCDAHTGNAHIDGRGYTIWICDECQ